MVSSKKKKCHLGHFQIFRCLFQEERKGFKGYQRGEKHGLSHHVLPWKEGFPEEGQDVMDTAGLRYIPRNLFWKRCSVPRSLVSCGHFIPLHSHSLPSWTLGVFIFSFGKVGLRLFKNPN